MKKRLVALLCLIVLGPVVPLYLLGSLLQFLVDAIDWAVEERAWAQPLVNASERIERYFRVDADSEYEDWRRRMGFGIATKKMLVEE